MDDRDHSPAEVSVEDLTWREQEVLTLLAERLTNREIGTRLHLAESTVKDYVGNILGKLYVKNRRQAVERAKELGLLDPVRKVSSRPAYNLPAESTPFIGRANQLAEVSRLLTDTRLLTLTGPGGIGKTRLALQSASDLLDDFENGVFFVALAAISSGKHVVQAIAETIGFPLSTEEEPIDQLLRYLRHRRLLLVMDNFEHLLDSADVLSPILQGAPDVKVLATSRERLNLQGETALKITGMDVPIWEPPDDLLAYDAIQLFLQGVRRVLPRFEPVANELKYLAEICQMVQGMPLAIELAAAWTEVLSLEEISQELQKGLDILTTEMRDVPERHRSIRAVFDHSWLLMEQAERDVLARLSVFRGGFTRQAAQQVAASSLPTLAGLTNKSLLRHDPNSGRFEVHELLRQYAQERLEETSETSIAAHEAHATYYASFMQERWEHLKDSRQIVALDEIEADIENVRTAWRYRVNQRNATQMWMFVNSFRFLYNVWGWHHAGMELFREAAEALRHSAPDDEEAEAVRAVAQASQAYFMAFLGLSEQGYELAHGGVATLERLNHPLDLAMALDSLGLTSYYLMRYEEEEEASRKMLEIATEYDDKSLIAYSLAMLCMVALRREDYLETRQFAEASVKANEDLGNAVGSVYAYLGLGHAAFGLEEYEEARGYFLRSQRIAASVGFRWAIGNSTKYLGQVALAMDEIPAAEAHFLENLKIAEDIGLGRDRVNLLYELARVRVAETSTERAVELLALVSRLPASHQARLGRGRIRDSAQALLATLQDELSPEAYAAALERGQALELDEVVAELLRGQG